LICISVAMTKTTHPMFPFFEGLLPRFASGDVHDLLTIAGPGGQPSLLAILVAPLLRGSRH
jgi:hypothetical protein